MSGTHVSGWKVVMGLMIALEDEGGFRMEAVAAGVGDTERQDQREVALQAGAQSRTARSGVCSPSASATGTCGVAVRRYAIADALATAGRRRDAHARLIYHPRRRPPFARFARGRW